MSFSSELKNEIIASSFKKQCCRKAFLQAVIAAKGELFEKGIMLGVGTEETAYIAALVKEIYSAEVSKCKSKIGGRRALLYFESSAARKYLQHLHECHNLLYDEKCATCRSAFLRGIFVACGRMSDPSKQFCLEFSLGKRVFAFKEVLDEMGLDMKIAERKSEMLLYTKNSTRIEEFFGMAELNTATFEVMNTKIANEFKNNANRVRNFDTVNISKSVDTSREQTLLINKLAERGLLNQLPSELEETARLRLENPHMSLSQLALHSLTPISKSGMSHRMMKIIKLAKELLE